VRVAIESERVAGAVSEQTPDGFPRSHLRQKRQDGTNDPRAASTFTMKRSIPPSLAAKLRHQKGYNKFISPWVVAIADPRASEQYVWPQGTTAQQKRDAGCFECERPQHLRGKTEADGVYELYSSGRILAVRPDLCTANCTTNVFTGTPYSYLGTASRFTTRFATVMADTVRTPEVLVAAQNPPIASGMLQETTYLHSGEVEVSNVDLDAEGRAGWNVAVRSHVPLAHDRRHRARCRVGSELPQAAARAAEWRHRAPRWRK
jgi:hypothetical protein